MVKDSPDKLICQNKKAYHDYYILEEYEAGIVLTGTEIKSIRDKKANLIDSYCYIKGNEIFIIGLHISHYVKGNIFNHDPDRTRKLLLHKKQILKIGLKKDKDGCTIIPLRLVIRNGLAKIDLALAKGKKLYDKREDDRKKEQLKEVKTW